MKTRIKITDVTLRDGMHPILHRFTLDQVHAIARALDTARVDVIEVGHGDGLSGSSLTYGPGAHTDWEWIAAVQECTEHAEVTTILQPGVGTIDDLRKAWDMGVRQVRISTNCHEADITAQHIATARDLGMDVGGFLTLPHMLDAAGLAAKARLMESYGAHAVYVADSGGALVMKTMRDRIRALREALDPRTEVGVHAHQNLAVAVANTVMAVEEGVTRVDASLAGMGAGGGNAAIEAFVAVAGIYEWEFGCDLLALQDAADDIVRPIMGIPVQTNRESISLGLAGVYSSFLRHAQIAAREYGVDPRSIIFECGRRGLVGGQEDMIADVALDLARPSVV